MILREYDEGVTTPMAQAEGITRVLWQAIGIECRLMIVIIMIMMIVIIRIMMIMRMMMIRKKESRGCYGMTLELSVVWNN